MKTSTVKIITILSLGLMFLALALYATTFSGGKDWASFGMAFAITTLNFIAGYLSFRWGMKRDQKEFLIIVFGGMFLKLCFILLLIFIILKFFDITTSVFIFVVFISYIFYLVIEVLYLSTIKEIRFNNE